MTMFTHHHTPSAFTTLSTSFLESFWENRETFQSPAGLTLVSFEAEMYDLYTHESTPFSIHFVFDFYEWGLRCNQQAHNDLLAQGRQGARGALKLKESGDITCKEKFSAKHVLNHIVSRMSEIDEQIFTRDSFAIHMPKGFLINSV
jgi:hypothetical protein